MTDPRWTDDTERLAAETLATHCRTPIGNSTLPATAQAWRRVVRPVLAALADAGSDLAGSRMAAGRRNLDDAVALLPTPTVRDADRGRGWGDQNGRPLSETIMRLLPTPRATDGDKGGPNQKGSSGDLMLPSAVQPNRWNQYGPAITRWEQVTGRPAPAPTEPGRTGNPRLSARFVEWMMGLDPGHVTDLLPRNPAMRVLGNGLVPVQGASAYRALAAVDQ